MGGIGQKVAANALKPLPVLSSFKILRLSKKNFVQISSPNLYQRNIKSLSHFNTSLAPLNTSNSQYNKHTPSFFTIYLYFLSLSLSFFLSFVLSFSLSSTFCFFFLICLYFLSLSLFHIFILSLLL